ncbi:IclR family transcriptional regulator [Actinopolyspora mortivallis]|uniref:IclR family transcriptional regulator n=1 Tax=Actinopolyspora mortivallis TaxID=33906 RepID=UPI00037C915F|nr:IclR family transcriptional regulator [Actinopolyspora mortivallis]
MTETTGTGSSDAVEHTELRVLDRAFTLLRILNTRGFPLTLKELSEYSGIPKSSTHRLLNALINRELVERVGATYRIRGRAIEFGDEETRFHVLRSRLLPYLTRLREVTGYTVELSVLIGPEVTVVCRLGGRIPRAGNTERSERVPAHTTAAGKVLLAHHSGAAQRYLGTGYFHATNPTTATSEANLLREFHEARRCSVAFDGAETPSGRRSAATPVWGLSRVPVAALSVTAQAPVFREALARRALLSTGRHAGAVLRRDRVSEQCRQR